MTETTTVCRRCKQELPSSEFYGTEKSCKKCRNERAQQNKANGIRKRTPSAVIARGNRICTVCQKELPTSEFYGANAKCKPCFAKTYAPVAAKRRKERRAADPEAARARERELYQKWKQTRPEGWRRAVRNGRLKETYGITIDDLDRMIEECKATCQICSEVQLDPYKMHVDHCHTTGAIRGLICGKCNVGIGMFRDNPEYLIRAAEYLTRG